MAKDFREKLLAVLLAFVAFQLLFFTFIPKVPGIPFPPEFGTLGFVASMVSASLITFIAFQNHVKSSVLWLLSLSSTLAIISLFRGSIVDRVFLGLTSIALFITALISILVARLPRGVVDLADQTFFLVVRWALSLKSTQSTAKNQLGSFKQGVSFWRAIHGNILAAVIRGILITIPVAFLIIVLLSSADPVFSANIKSIFSVNWDNLPYWIIGRTIFSLAFLSIVISVFYLTPEKLKTHVKESTSYLTEATILTTTIVTILLGFLIIQFKYLFSNVAETDLIQFGVKTYSEYVRKGFGELVIVSGIVYLVSNFALSAIKSSKAIILKLTTSVLLIELLVFIFSVFRRVYLYQYEHGFTRIRLYGSGFLIVLAVLTIILAIRLFVKSKHWFLLESGIVIAGIILITTINVDVLVSKYFQPTVNNEVDYVYISRLSSDSVDGWMEAYNHAYAMGSKIFLLSRNLTEEEKRELMYAYWTSLYVQRNYRLLAQNYGNDEVYLALDRHEPKISPLDSSDIRKFNVSDYFAYKKLRDHIKPEEISKLTKMLEDKFMSIDPNLRFQNFDRDLYSPLVW